MQHLTQHLTECERELQVPPWPALSERLLYFSCGRTARTCLERLEASQLAAGLLESETRNCAYTGCACSRRAEDSSEYVTLAVTVIPLHGSRGATRYQAWSAMLHDMFLGPRVARYNTIFGGDATRYHAWTGRHTISFMDGDVTRPRALDLSAARRPKQSLAHVGAVGSCGTSQRLKGICKHICRVSREDLGLAALKSNDESSNTLKSLSKIVNPNWACTLVCCFSKRSLDKSYGLLGANLILARRSRESLLFLQVSPERDPIS